MAVTVTNRQACVVASRHSNWPRAIPVTVPVTDSRAMSTARPKVRNDETTVSEKFLRTTRTAVALERARVIDATRGPSRAGVSQVSQSFSP
ncbi:hypothetical protein GCM10009764_62820 [Nocardia ninae]